MVKDEAIIEWNEKWNAKGQKNNYSIMFNITLFSENYSTIKECLNGDELDELDNLRNERRIRSYLFGRYSLKRNVANYINEKQLRKISILNGVFLQPIINHPYSAIIGGSLSHCNKCAASLVYNEALIMGIDIEERENDFHNIMITEVTKNEMDIFKNIALSSQLLYGVLWTTKESLSKCLRTGLTIPFYIMEIDNLTYHGLYFESTFRHFSQYRTITFIMKEQICSITYPKNVTISFDVEKIVSKINNMMLINDLVKEENNIIHSKNWI